MSEKIKGWTDLPEGARILNPGNSCEYQTGTWRSFRPIHDKEKCINCLTCWVMCPEAAVVVEDGKVVKIDLDYCKGCGICANECPKEAITMIKEDRSDSE